MKITWNYTIENQSEKYFKCAEQIYTGFYQQCRYYVLPFLPEKFRDRVVYFPDIPEFTQSFDLYTQQLIKEKNSLFIPSSVKDAINNFVQKKERYFEKKLNTVKNIMEKYNEDVLEGLKKIYPKELSIIITPSFFGTSGHYDSVQNNELKISPRIDRDPMEIYKLIITAISHELYTDEKYHIQNMNALPYNQWLTKQNKSTELFNNLFSQKYGKMIGLAKETTKTLKNNYAGNLAIESLQYLEKLGHPLVSTLIKVEQIKNLSATEKSILQELLNNRGNIVKFDRIGDLMWQASAIEKYSLYAISKAIERIRRKLELSSINQNIIHTERGKGYLLYD